MNLYMDISLSQCKANPLIVPLMGEILKAENILLNLTPHFLLPQCPPKEKKIQALLLPEEFGRKSVPLISDDVQTETKLTHSLQVSCLEIRCRQKDRHVAA